MRIFVTGATGYIGTAVTRILVGAGHDVTGLTRSAESAADLRELGGTPLSGALTGPATWTSAAAEHEAIIHLAYDYGVPAGPAIDERAVAALVAAATSGPRVFVYTSGVWVLGSTGDVPADEDAAPRPAAAVAWRPAQERRTLDAATATLATAVIRPGMVYGGTAGLVTPLFRSALDEGAATFVGDGRNRWPLVYRDDVAQLYRLVVEQQARGIFHAVEPGCPPVSRIAAAASRAAGCDRTRAFPLEAARARMGVAADACCLDQVVVARRATELGWRPAHAPFLESAGEVLAELQRGELP
ncbi:MAG TPA: NAD-dependent epimerase/dehydratase family protein [Polyangia bacterium]|jgi:nucleoside-diphosphate-sugar epimerase